MILWHDTLGKRELVWTCGEKKYQKDDLIKVSSFTVRKYREFTRYSGKSLSVNASSYGHAARRNTRRTISSRLVILLLGNVENFYGTLQDILGKCELIWTCGRKKYQKDDLIKVSSSAVRNCREFT